MAKSGLNLGRSKTKKFARLGHDRVAFFGSPQSPKFDSQDPPRRGLFGLFRPSRGNILRRTKDKNLKLFSSKYNNVILTINYVYI